MSNSQHHKLPDNTPISLDLAGLYDEFVELHNSCSFLFEAINSLLAVTDIDRASVEGFSAMSWQVRTRANKLKEEFKRVHEKSLHPASIRH